MRHDHCTAKESAGLARCLHCPVQLQSPSRAVMKPQSKALSASRIWAARMTYLEGAADKSQDHVSVQLHL